MGRVPVSFVYKFHRLISTRIPLLRTGVLLCTFGLMSVLSVPASAAVVISEFMASNDSTLVGEDGQYSDWNVVQVNIEPNDVFTVLPQQLDLTLKVRAP